MRGSREGRGASDIGWKGSRHRHSLLIAGELFQVPRLKKKEECLELDICHSHVVRLDWCICATYLHI